MIVCIYPTDDGEGHHTLELNGKDFSVLMVLSKEDLFALGANITAYENEQDQ